MGVYVNIKNKYKNGNAHSQSPRRKGLNAEGAELGFS